MWCDVETQFWGKDDLLPDYMHIFGLQVCNPFHHLKIGSRARAWNKVASLPRDHMMRK